MKIKLMRLGMLALAALATLAPQAKAQPLIASTGDFVLAFKQNGNANDLVVNLGSITNFLQAGQAFGTANNFIYAGTTGAYASGATFTLSQLAVTNLTNGFTDWTDGDQLNPVQWGGIGYNGDSASLNLPGRTFFYTQPRLSEDDPSNSFNRKAYAGSASAAAAAFNFVNNGVNGAATAGTSSSAFILASGANSFSSLDSVENNYFAWGGSLTHESTGNGPTDVLVDLYASITTNGDGFSAAAGGAAPTRLGYFQLTDAGVLTYTAVPEPSTYALLALGGGMLLFLRHRFKKTVVAVK